MKSSLVSQNAIARVSEVTEEIVRISITLLVPYNKDPDDLRTNLVALNVPEARQHTVIRIFEKNRNQFHMRHGTPCIEQYDDVNCPMMKPDSVPAQAH